MALFLYNAFLILYSTGIRLAALGNAKARQWLKGREKFPELKAKGQYIWMHCASLGEFEQGRPVMEAIKKAYPGYLILITFFSPSGYEVRKNYPGADAVFYLPLDGKRNAKRFIEMVNPKLVLWIKYEYWYYYLDILKKKGIPVLLISGIFRESHPVFKLYGGLWHKMLECFQRIFVQNDSSLLLLKGSGFNENVQLSGDTRFDRVSDIAAAGEEIIPIRDFCAGKKVVVAGSTWEDDEDEFLHYVHQHTEMNFIIAPHLVDPESLKEVKQRFKDVLLYSELISGGQKTNTSNVLIIDNIGMLSRIYRYADITYVGGGFGNDGIHNILEAAVYGKPVIIGPVYDRFFEAVELIERGGCFSIGNALELEALLNRLFNDESELKKAGEAAGNYVKESRGATKVILDYIQANRLLTN